MNMFESIRIRVCKENVRLKESGLISLSWGNVSEIDRENNIIAIKPSGVSYDTMTPDDIVIVDLDGNVVSGRLKPSSDLPTHIEIYKNFKEIGGITHTHSKWATVFSQAGRSIEPLGTTHADTFYGAVPCTRKMTKAEISGAYEKETGKVICETFKDINPLDVPAVLVHSHGPFTFGKDASKSVDNAIVLEEVAMMAWHTIQLNSDIQFQKELLDKHYYRKHGENAYYGQGDKQ